MEQQYGSSRSHVGPGRVVETGSFSAAGRKLGVPLPTVSRKVSDLEAHLKTQLLIRSTRKLAF